jgi:tetratricopeptide (TPR) repeat protein
MYRKNPYRKEGDFGIPFVSNVSIEYTFLEKPWYRLSEPTVTKFPIILSVLFCFCLTLTACGGDGDSPKNASTPVSATDPEALTREAFRKQEIGAFHEAVELLEKAVSVDPGYLAAHVRMGDVYREWDRRKEALRAYEQALVIDSGNVESRLGLAEVYAKMNRNDMAIREYLKIVETRPDDMELHFKLALEYWYIQNLEGAAKHYNKVIALDHNHLQAHLNLASVYEKMKEWENALKEIEIAQRLGREKNDEHAISIAEKKLGFIKGRMNLSKEDYNRKTPPTGRVF